ncbi:hypothetical protein MMC31_002283 [Peltigera leucophlebia]|nr:hypothetical protein [Peltigera leucophlebia]
MGDERKIQIKRSESKQGVRKLLGVESKKYDHDWAVFEHETKIQYPKLELDARTSWGVIHPNTTKAAVDTVKEMCEGFRMDLDDECLGQLVEWKLWQLHRAATRKIELGGASRGQNRGQSGGESRGGSEGASGDASGGGSGKASEPKSTSSKQPAYDPVRDFG